MDIHNQRIMALAWILANKMGVLNEAKNEKIGKLGKIKNKKKRKITRTDADNI